MGVAPVGTTYPNWVLSSNSSQVTQNGNLIYNHTTVYTFGARAQGDVIGIAVDVDNRLIWFKVVSGSPGLWNGATANGNPVTGLNGITVPAGSIIPYIGFGTNQDVYTANFGASAFVGAAPTGFVAWPSNIAFAVPTAAFPRVACSGSTAPTAPVLTLVSATTTATFTVDIDNTIGAGDNIELQIQVTGGSWTTLVSDTNHTITSGEDSANQINLSLGLPNGSYDARARVTDTVGTGLTSAWSNTVVNFTISGASAPGIYFLMVEGF
jgi:hypothetical protein